MNFNKVSTKTIGVIVFLFLFKVRFEIVEAHLQMRSHGDMIVRRAAIVKNNASLGRHASRLLILRRAIGLLQSPQLERCKAQQVYMYLFESIDSANKVRQQKSTNKDLCLSLNYPTS